MTHSNTISNSYCTKFSWGSTWNEAAPCNIALMRQAQSVKKGVRAFGGTPREFCTITVTDGIAMGHEGMKSSLISREVIADSEIGRAHV